MASAPIQIRRNQALVIDATNKPKLTAIVSTRLSKSGVELTPLLLKRCYFESMNDSMLSLVTGPTNVLTA